MGKVVLDKTDNWVYKELAQLQKDPIFSVSLSVGDQNVWLVRGAACSRLFYFKVDSLILRLQNPNRTQLLRQLSTGNDPELIPSTSDVHYPHP
jgi:hypothetical protein